MKHIDLNWELIDHTDLKTKPVTGNGIYMFVMKACGNPTYVGTAEKGLSRRLRKHASFFKYGLRFYYTDQYFELLDTEASPWFSKLQHVHYDQPGELAQYAYVPGTGMVLNQAQSLAYWNTRLQVIVAKLNGDDLSQVKKIETALQYKLEDHVLNQNKLLDSRSINVRMPKVRSSLFGKREHARDTSILVRMNFGGLEGNFSALRSIFTGFEGQRSGVA